MWLGTSWVSTTQPWATSPIWVGYQQPSHGPRVPFELDINNLATGYESHLSWFLFVCLFIYLFCSGGDAILGLALVRQVSKTESHLYSKYWVLWFKSRSNHYSSPGTVLQSCLAHIGLLWGVHVCSASSSLAFTGRHTLAEVCLVFCPLSCGQPVRRKNNSIGELVLLISKYGKNETQGNWAVF